MIRWFLSSPPMRIKNIFLRKGALLPFALMMRICFSMSGKLLIRLLQKWFSFICRGPILIPVTDFLMMHSRSGNYSEIKYSVIYQHCLSWIGFFRQFITWRQSMAMILPCCIFLIMGNPSVQTAPLCIMRQVCVRDTMYLSWWWPVILLSTTSIMCISVHVVFPRFFNGSQGYKPKICR